MAATFLCTHAAKRRKVKRRKLVATYDDMVTLHKVWWNIKADIFAEIDAEKRMYWYKIKGPIGAIIGTPMDIGWNPVSPTKWVDDDGNTWEYKGEGSLGPLLGAIRESVERKIWKKAEKRLWK